MTRTWLLLLGALATVTFATVVLVLLPEALLVKVQPAAELRDYHDTESRGREVYIENGCFYCHSQQLRDSTFTSDVARGWGRRASVPADYVFDRPHLLGTMRTGPDLLNVGARIPDRQWHLIHLYQPRSVVPWSIMPAFPYLFELRDSSAMGPSDVSVPVPASAVSPGKVVIATRDAVALVEYLLSLDRNYPVGGEPIESPASPSPDER